MYCDINGAWLKKNWINFRKAAEEDFCNDDDESKLREPILIKIPNETDNVELSDFNKEQLTITVCNELGYFSIDIPLQTIVECVTNYAINDEKIMEEVISAAKDKAKKLKNLLSLAP